jgi:hypothetical protein
MVDSGALIELAKNHPRQVRRRPSLCQYRGTPNFERCGIGERNCLGPIDLVSR